MQDVSYKLKQDQYAHLKPREKMEQGGADVLSNAELLAIVLGVGNRRESVLDMASRVIKDYGVSALAAVRDYEKIQTHLQLGRVKAMQVTAVLELGRRIYLESDRKRMLLNSPDKVYNKYKYLAQRDREEVRVLYLNSRQMLIISVLISIGSVDFVFSRKRDILSPALEYNASGFILLHNHPSEGLSPSEEDMKFSKNLLEASKLLEVKFLDNIIVGKDGYYSFRETGLLEDSPD